VFKRRPWQIAVTLPKNKKESDFFKRVIIYQASKVFEDYYR